MTLEIDRNSHLMQWPTHQHQQGNFDLLMKQQLENGSHHLPQQEPHSELVSLGHPDDSTAFARHSAQSLAATNESHDQYSVEADKRLAGGYFTSIMPLRTGAQVALNQTNVSIDTTGASTSFINMPTVRAAGLPTKLHEATCLSNGDVSARFKPANLLVIKEEQLARLYIRDFFADEREIIRWTEEYILDSGRDLPPLSHIFINGKPFRFNGTNLVQEKDNHGY